MIQQMHQQFKTQLGGEARRNSPIAWLIGVLLLILIFWLFVQLWVGNATIPEIFFLNQDIKAQKRVNQALEKENEQRIQQIKSLKGGDEELEARARLELGMLKPGEVFYEVPTATPSINASVSSSISSISSVDKTLVNQPSGSKNSQLSSQSSSSVLQVSGLQAAGPEAPITGIREI